MVALLLLVPAPAVGAGLGVLAVPGALGTAIYAFCKVWILLVPIGWLRFVEKRGFSLSPLRHGGLVAGAASGLAMSAAIVGAYLWLGQGREQNEVPLHHPRYDFNDAVMPTGIRMFVALAERHLRASEAR